MNSKASKPNASPQRLEWLLSWPAIVVAGLAAAWVSGRLEFQLVPDSPSYLEYPFGSLEAIGRSIRTPGYPLFLLALARSLGLAAVPVAQVIVHATAVWALAAQMKGWAMPLAERLAVAIAVGLGCTPMDHIAVVSTDALAASIGVGSAAATLRWARHGGPLRDAWLPAALVAAAILIRPAYLFLLPWLAVAGVLLLRQRAVRWRPAIPRSLTLAGFAAVPVIVWMTIRLVAVGDFALVPFGHQNLAGVLVQLASDRELERLPGTAGEVGRAVVAEKAALAESGHRFAEGAPRATMTIDARWDEMTYFVVVPASEEVAGDDPIAQHHVLAELDRAIVSRYPLRYALWVAKAFRRGAWAVAADITMHPLFLGAILVAFGMVLWRAPGPKGFSVRVGPSPALSAMAIVALTYLVMKVGFVSLTSPPIGRFSDAAAIFLPAWFAAGFVAWWRSSC